MSSSLHRSFAELGFWIKRAATGAGLSHGEGEELAGNAAFLAARGFDPSGLVARVLDKYTVVVESGKNLPSGWIRNIAEADEVVCQLMGGGYAEFETDSKSETLLQLAQVARCLIENDSGDISISINNGPGQNFGAAFAILEESSGDDESPTLPIVLRLKISEPMDPQGSAMTGVDVDADAWAVIDGYFRQSLVPSSDASRTGGAGAGLTDND